ncbi:hypothetical protein DEJ44_32110 [Streptomyces venezuelae]|uniref:hypothetical protein n=1 Tax=Streptomyces venezuelae TaxID=54571 RepID=UPI00123864AC|nr:hypothetical protein [Streptomyces venezuelae]QES09819.1 hypothetical protein DEJ44_32110 [Streptomyces venezuelae]
MTENQNPNRKFNDPTDKVEQYSLEYLRKLRTEAPEQMLALWRAGHFSEAIAEEGASKAANKKYRNNVGTTGAKTREWAADRGVDLDDESPSF